MNTDHADIGVKERKAGRDILGINEEELCRIILDIHDGPVQNMYAALSQINTLQGKLAVQATAAPNGDTIVRTLTQVAGLLERSLTEIKHFIGTFRPPEFQKRDLVSMLKGLIIQHESLTDNHIEMEVTEPLPNVPVPVKIALYRILQEGLSNASRHAGTDRQQVYIHPKDNGVCLEVADHGAGFEPSHVLGQSETKPLHLGLRGMQNRVDLLGGRLEVQSTPGQGTRISVWVPCYDEPGD